MKSKIIFLLLALSVFFLSSCSSLPGNCLAYQESPFSAEIAFRADGCEYVMAADVSGRDTYTVRFISPEPLSGFVLSKESGESFVEFGGMRIPTGSGTSLGIAEKTLSLLFLKKSDIKEISKSRLNGLELDVVNFKTPLGTAKMFTDSENGLPVCIEADENGSALRIDIRFCKKNEAVSSEIP